MNKSSFKDLQTSYLDSEMENYLQDIPDELTDIDVLLSLIKDQDQNENYTTGVNDMQKNLTIGLGS